MPAYYIQVEEEKVLTKLVPGFLGYYRVSQDGRVFSCRVYGSRLHKTGPWWELKPKTRIRYGKKCHPYVDLFRTVGKPERHGIHQLVLLAFKGACPIGQETRHLNDVKGDNRLENLCYGTKKENREDASHNGILSKGEQRWNAVFTNAQVKELKRLYRKGYSKKQLALMFNNTQKHIGKILAGQIWKHIP